MGDPCLGTSPTRGSRAVGMDLADQRAGGEPARRLGTGHLVSLALDLGGFPSCAQDRLPDRAALVANGGGAVAMSRPPDPDGVALLARLRNVCISVIPRNRAAPLSTPLTS